MVLPNSGRRWLIVILVLVSAWGAGAQRQPQPTFTPIGTWQPEPEAVAPTRPLPPSRWAPTSPAPASADLVTTLVELMNRERTQAGRSPLRLEQRLMTAARGHSEEMAHTRNFSHTGKRPGRSRPADRVEAEGYNYQRVAENIYMAMGTPESRLASDCVRAWMESPGHRRNILEAESAEVGVGVARNEAGEVYITAVYARGF